MMDQIDRAETRQGRARGLYDEQQQRIQQERKLTPSKGRAKPALFGKDG